MTSPWEKPGRGRKKSAGISNFWRLVIFGAVLVLLLLGLNQMFPDWGGRGPTFSLVHSILLVTLVAGPAFLYARSRPGLHLKNAAIWLGIFVVVIIGASFWEELRGLGNRVAGNLVPGRVVVQGDEFWVQRAEGGHFWLLAEVNGVEVRFMVDTGASTVALTMKDAERLGYDLAPENFVGSARTANGRVKFAPIRIRSIRISGFEMLDVQGTVIGGELNTSLLGMSYLSRLSGFEFRGDRLYLRP